MKTYNFTFKLGNRDSKKRMTVPEARRHPTAPGFFYGIGTDGREYHFHRDAIVSSEKRKD